MTNYKTMAKAIFGFIAGLLLATALLPIAASAHEVPACSLDASPQKIVAGESTTLSWSTENATSVSIDNGIGDVDPTDSLRVEPTVTTTYTLTAEHDDESVTCRETITVLPATAVPTCSLSANPTNITQGGSSTLQWETFGADTVYINNGVGHVNSDGSAQLTGFSSDVTYILTATNGNGSKTCSATVNVDDDTNSSYLAPTCTMSATPQSVSYNGSVILNWTSNGASSARIDNGVGVVQKQGSKVVEHITKATTFKLVVTNEYGSNACSVTVYMDTIPEGPAPTCIIDIDPDSLSYAQRAILSWSAYHSNSATISSGVGNVDLTGVKLISPSKSTTYTMTVRDSLGRVGYCAKTVTVQDGAIYFGSGYGAQYPYGSSYTYPSTYYSGTAYSIGSTIPLTSLPYTGAEDIAYVLAVLMLALASGAGLYFGRGVWSQPFKV